MGDVTNIKDDTEIIVIQHNNLPLCISRNVIKKQMSLSALGLYCYLMFLSEINIQLEDILNNETENTITDALEELRLNRLINVTQDGIEVRGL